MCSGSRRSCWVSGKNQGISFSTFGIWMPVCLQMKAFASYSSFSLSPVRPNLFEAVSSIMLLSYYVEGFFLNSLLEVRLDPLVEMETFPHCYLCRVAFRQMATMQRSSGKRAAEKKSERGRACVPPASLSPSNRLPTAVLHEAN